MPLKQIGPRPQSAIAGQLLARLIVEWKNPSPSAPQPIILEERGRSGQLEHVYVVWDEWAPLEADERSSLILDASEDVNGSKPTMDITVAMGLTTAEADRLRIPYK